MRRPGTTTPATDTETIAAPDARPDREAALSSFIAGSLEENKGNHEGAIVEFMRALAHDDDASIHYALAKNYLAIEKPGPALQFARNAVERAPKNLEYLGLLGGLHMSVRQLDSAMLAFEAARALDSTQPQILYMLGSLYSGTQRSAEAAEMFERLIVLAGPELELLVLAADEHAAAGDTARAIQRFEEYRALDPFEEYPIVKLSQLYAATHRMLEARAMKRVVADLHPASYGHVLGAARMHIEAGLWREADTILQRYFASDSLTVEEAASMYVLTYPYIPDTLALEADERTIAGLVHRFPGTTDLTLRLADVRLRRGMYDSTVAVARRVLATEPLNGFAHMLLARAYLMRDMYEESIAPLQSLIDLQKDDADIWSWLGFALDRLGARERAEDALRHALALDSTRMDALSTLALSLDNRREYARSDSLYERALAMYEGGTVPRDASYYLICNNFAYTLAERGRDLERAQQLARIAVEEEPGNSSYLDTIGWIHFHRGEYEAALVRIREAIAVRRAQDAAVGPVLYDHLGDVLAAMGRTAEAAEAWRSALREDPTLTAIQDKLLHIGR
jgi:predicted Zn-dependent protease